MIFNAPEPRYRIYKGPHFYSNIFSELIKKTWNQGDALSELEKTAKKKFDVPYSLATAQARVAIHLAIKASISDHRREVILSPYTIFDVINMVITAGGIPVFADLEENTCNVSLDSIQEAVTENTAIVMVTHLQGLACDIINIKNFCKEKGLILIEDAAQALGCEVEGRQVGTFGDIGIFSFGLAKNVNGILGGMAVTHSNNFYQAMKTEEGNYPSPSLKEFIGKTVGAIITDLTLTPLLFKILVFWIFRFGYLNQVEFLNKRVTVEDDPQVKKEFPEHYKRKMLPLQARLILKQFSEIDHKRELRRNKAKLYYEGLKDIPEIGMPEFPEDNSHVYLHFPILVRDRHALVRHLMKNNRDCSVQHLKNCADLSCFESHQRDCPVARKTAEETMLLPCYSQFSINEVQLMIKHTREFFGRV